MTIRYFATNSGPDSHANAIQGDDSWNGLFPTYQGGSNGPKRDPINFNMDNLNPGDEIRLAEGSHWVGSFGMFIENPTGSMSRDNMIVFGSYDPGLGATGRPKFTSGTYGLFIGGFGGSGPATRGGYLFQNIEIVGPFSDADDAGILLNPPHKWVIFDNCKVSGYQAGISVRSEPAASNSYVLIKDCDLRGNRLAGVLGCCTQFTIENTFFTGNGNLHSLTHAIYAGSSQHESKAVTIRQCRLIDNNIDGDGVCVGGNLTIRGMLDGTHINDNIVRNTGGKFVADAWGISHRPAYSSEEYHLNTIIRRNSVSNFQTLITFSSAPGCIVEGNDLLDEGTAADSCPAVNFIGFPVGDLSEEDTTQDDAAIVRNNSIRSVTPRAGTKGVFILEGNTNHAGANIVIDGNTFEFEGTSPGNVYAMDITDVDASYASISDNTLTGGDGWHPDYASTAAFEGHFDGLAGCVAEGNTGP